MKAPARFPSKICLRCGRTIEYRKKWERDWSGVKYCGEKCRRAGAPSPDDERRILELLKSRGNGKTICPSEILEADDKKKPERMELVRQAARRMADAGLIVITQGGAPVDPSKFRGPIRIKLKK